MVMYVDEQYHEYHEQCCPPMPHLLCVACPHLVPSPRSVKPGQPQVETTVSTSRASGSLQHSDSSRVGFRYRFRCVFVEGPQQKVAFHLTRKKR